MPYLIYLVDKLINLFLSIIFAFISTLLSYSFHKNSFEVDILRSIRTINWMEWSLRINRVKKIDEKIRMLMINYGFIILKS